MNFLLLSKLTSGWGVGSFPSFAKNFSGSRRGGRNVPLVPSPLRHHWLLYHFKCLFLHTGMHSCFILLPHFLQRLRQRRLHVLISLWTRLPFDSPETHAKSPFFISWFVIRIILYKMNIIRSFWDSASICIIGIRWYKLEGLYCRFFKQNPGVPMAFKNWEWGDVPLVY